MKIVLMLMTLLLSISAFASALICRANNEPLTFETVGYAGGARPQPGMLIRKTQWYYNYQTIYLQRKYEPCRDGGRFCGPETNEVDPQSNIAWEFNQETKVVISNENTGGYFSKEVYSIDIELFSTEPGVNMTGLNWEKITLPFICEDIRTYYP